MSLEQTKSLALSGAEICWQEAGQGEPLVMLHGWSMSHAVFAELVERLKDRYRLLIPDLPGHGCSDPLETCSLKSLAHRLAEWLSTFNLENCHLLGWSLGGQVALRLALDFPQLFDRLALIASTPRFCATDDWRSGLPETQLRAMLRGIQRRYQATMGEFFDLQFSPGEISAERRREILGFAVRPIGLPHPQAASQTLAVLGQEDLRSELPGIRQDVLILHGTEDRIIPFSAGRFLEERISRARLVEFDGVGHAPFFTRPDEVARHVGGFFA